MTSCPANWLSLAFAQLNKKPTRSNNILDLVITSVPNRVNVTDILSPKDTGVFTDHGVIIFQFNPFIKAPLKTLRFVYDYAKGDFEGLRRDQSDRGGGGVLIVMKTASFRAVNEFKPKSEAELEQLDIIFAEITTLTGQRILFRFCYGPSNEDPSWMDVFDNFLHEVCASSNIG